MTGYSAFAQANPGALNYTGNTGSTFSLLVTLSMAQPLLGIWYYSGPSETTLPDTCGVWDMAAAALVPGTQNLSPTWSGAAGSGWVKCSYDGSILLTSTAVAAYAPAVHWASGNKGYLSGYSAFPVTGPGGVVTAPVRQTVGVANCPYHNGGWALPDTDGGGGFWWGVDIEVGSPAFTATYVSTDGNGAQTWSVYSSLNGGPGPVSTRVLPPSAPSSAYPHSFLLTLPVEPGQGSSFGDPLATIEALGAHNQYNLTVMQPGYAIDPWYADNPLDTTVSQETFTLDALSWLQANFSVTGHEKVYLIGFSKSGIGGQGLIFRHPAVFQACASWDAPFGMTDYDGTDPDYPSSPVGGGPSAVYGTSANFKSNYELDPVNLAAWKAASNFGTVNRLWTGGYFAFQGDVTAYDTTLTTAGILHSYALVLASAHNWAPTPGWVGPALAAMFPAPSSSGLLMAGII